LADRRTYEVVIIIDPKSTEEEVTTLIGNLRQTIETQGGTITKSEDMGMRRLAYEINHRTDGHYWLFEIEGTGHEIAELERRMRVNEAVVRFMTIRVDLERRRADKLQAKRSRRATRRPTGNRTAKDPFEAMIGAEETNEAEAA
jgi:small subunit ribosomal protein S6